MLTSTDCLQVRLADALPKTLLDDIYTCSMKKQTGVSLRYMLDFGANPIGRQLILSAQFLHNELPVRLAHRVAELENLPYGLSAKPHVIKVRASRACRCTQACHSIFDISTGLHVGRALAAWSVC